MILYDNQYEQLAIGLMLNNPDAAHHGFSRLTEAHFFDPNFRYAFLAIENLIKKNREINLYNTNEEVKGLGQAFSLDELISLEDKFYIPEKFNTIIDALKDRLRKRTALNELAKIQTDLKTSTKDYSSIIKSVGDLYNLADDESQEIVSGKNYIKIKERQDEIKRTRIPIYTGYHSLDNAITYKLGTGEISVIGARPSNGKSAW